MSTPPRHDAGYPEQGHKLCAEKLDGGTWCTKQPGHTGAHEGPPVRDINTAQIIGHYAQGTPKK